ncbi:alpha/beta hydrolase [Novosphingobium sp.]|uniref:alpha/beta hydrolase n=1 Tax=Novosphingobium sp. TaxID=1874826 RepID=UPI00263361D9|nr:alpha/beta hydrolase [Novosphingobium sp.]
MTGVDPTLARAAASQAKSGAALTAAERLAFVHPELREATANFLPLLETIPPLSDDVLPMMRDLPNPLAKPLDAKPEVSEKQISGLDGDPAIRVFTINASAGAKRPAILYFHGGGYVAGKAEGDLSDVQVLARELDCCIVVPDYRLAPETRFPGPVRDAYAALAWMHGNADAIGIDRSRIAVMGRSAGGGLAAMLTDMVRRRAQFEIVLQVLLYPMLDDRTGSVRAMPAHVEGIMWSSDQNRFGWRSLLGVEPGSASVPQGAVPGRYEDLKGMPPAWIGVGAIDLFFDESVDYARRLADTGIWTELNVVPASWHGFDMALPDLRISRAFRHSYTDALRFAFSGQLARSPK